MEEKILEYVQDISQKKGRQATLTTDLYAEGILDSLGIISLLSFLQDEFDVVFSPDDLQFENYQTVEEIIKWVKSQICTVPECKTS